MWWYRCRATYHKTGEEEISWSFISLNLKNEFEFEDENGEKEEEMRGNGKGHFNLKDRSKGKEIKLGCSTCGILANKLNRSV